MRQLKDLTAQDYKETDMVNGRDKVLESVEAELTFLDSMRKSGHENIEYAAQAVLAAEDKLKTENALQTRFEQRTDMCLKLKNALEEFGAGMESLKAL